MFQANRLPNQSGDGDYYPVSSLDLSPRSKYSVSQGPIYMHKHERRLGKRSTAPTTSNNDLFP